MASHNEKIVDYDIAVGNTPAELVTNVKKLINKGFIPCATGIQTYFSETYFSEGGDMMSFGSNFKYVQVMVLYEES